MSDFKGTPGPWVEVEKNANGHVMTKDGYAVHEHPVFSSITDGMQIEANARLIAAAPDLLEALKFFASLNPNDPNPRFAGHVRQARAAIAKAAVAQS